MLSVASFPRAIWLYITILCIYGSGPIKQTTGAHFMRMLKLCLGDSWFINVELPCILVGQRTFVVAGAVPNSAINNFGTDGMINSTSTQQNVFVSSQSNQPIRTQLTGTMNSSQQQMSSSGLTSVSNTLNQTTFNTNSQPPPSNHQQFQMNTNRAVPPLSMANQQSPTSGALNAATSQG